MAATVTNEGKGITTKTSGHTALSEEPDTCWNVPVTKQVPHVNHVTTDKAIEHTSGKTLFQNGNVVRVGEAMEPSEPAHGDTGLGGGVDSHTYMKEARATEGSPTVRAEGKAPARTDDPTTQNHANTDGKIHQDVSPEDLEDHPEMWLARCSYKESKIKCSHGDFTTLDQIDTWRGDIITVEAIRYNAKEPNKDPKCAEPPHMKWKVTRTGGVNLLGIALDPMSGDFQGDTLVLPIEYTAPMGSFTSEGQTRRNLSDDAKRQFIGMKNARAQELAAQRGSSRVESQDAQLAYQQTKQSIEATDRRLGVQNKDRLQQRVQTLASIAQLLVAWRASQNPVRIQIVGNACTGQVGYTVHCYPNSKYSFTLPKEPLIVAGRVVSRVLSFIRSFGQLANCPVESGFKIPGDAELTIEFQWKEQEPDKGKPETYRISREAELAVTGELFELKAELQFPLANFLALIPFAGALAARAVNWVLQRLGADASVGAGFKVTCKAQVSVTIKWSENKGLEIEGAFKIPIDLTAYLYARIRWGSTVHIEAQALVTADPAFSLECSADGVKLKFADFMVRIGFAGQVRIDTWFYTFEQRGEWFPESWTTRVRSYTICTIFGGD